MCVRERERERERVRCYAITDMYFFLIIVVLPRISGFTLSPISQVVLLGATAIFTCQRRDGDIAWRINGQRVNDPNVVTTSTMGVHMLMIMSAWSTYNGSMIQCRASFDDGRESELTTLAILQLQGKCAH